MPPHFGAADEAEEADPVAGDELLGNLVGARNSHAEFRWKPGFTQQLHEHHARDRRIGRGLDEHGATGGHRRRHLVSDEVDGMVEGAHSRYDADGFLDREREAPHRCGRALHRYFLAMYPRCFFGRDFHGVGRAGHLDAGVDQRLTALARDEQREFLVILTDEGSQTFENRAPLVRREAVGVFRECRGGHIQRPRHPRGVHQLNLGDGPSAVGGSHLENLGGRRRVARNSRRITRF